MNFWINNFWLSNFWVDGFWVGDVGDESAGAIKPGLVLTLLQYPSVTVELPQESPPV